MYFDLSHPISLTRLTKTEKEKNKPWNSGYVPKDFVVISPYAGSFDMEVGGVVFHVGTGSAITVPAGVFFRPVAVENVKYYVLHFTAKSVASIPEGGDSIRYITVDSVTPESRATSVKALFDRALTFNPFDSGATKAMLDTLTRELLIGISREFCEKVYPQESGLRLRREIVAYLATHSAEPITLSSLAVTFGCSPSYIARLFRVGLSSTVSEYLTDLRLQRATGLLLNTDLRVGEVAEVVGIHSPYYFSRLFRKRYGMTAHDYRIRGREEAPDPEN